MSILNEFYNGNIRPSEKFIKKENEYYKINYELSNKIDELRLQLSKEQKKLFDEIEILQFRVALFVKKNNI